MIPNVGSTALPTFRASTVMCTVEMSSSSCVPQTSRSVSSILTTYLPSWYSSELSLSVPVPHPLLESEKSSFNNTLGPLGVGVELPPPHASAATSNAARGTKKRWLRMSSLLSGKLRPKAQPVYGVHCRTNNGD